MTLEALACSGFFAPGAASLDRWPSHLGGRPLAKEVGPAAGREGSGPARRAARSPGSRSCEMPNALSATPYTAPLRNISAKTPWPPAHANPDPRERFPPHFHPPHFAYPARKCSGKEQL